jgi:nitrite reductase/ring-hydroxylating ferredoxin subunit
MLNGIRVVLARVGEQVHALADTCAHRGGPLSEAKLSGTRLACPWHGWIYDVRTGQCAFPGRGQAVASYRVRVDGTDLWVEIP